MMRSKTVFAGILFLVNVACSDTGSNDNDSGGSAGQPTAGSAGSAGSGGSGTGGMGGTSSGGKGGSSAAGSAGKAGSGGGSGLLEGTCGQRIVMGTTTVTDTTFDGVEEFYIIDDGGLGTEVCIVEFDLTRVGEAPAGCVDLDAAPCEWTHTVAYSNPRVVLGEDGVCASSSPLALDAAALAAIDGTEVSYGYIFEYQGHPSVVMKHDPARDTWDSFGLAGYDDMSGAFTFTHPEGFCTYSPPP